MSPVRVCLKLRCPRPATYRGLCRVHARDRERRTNRVGYKLYRSKRWTNTRKRKLRETPLCERCGQIGTDVHHRIDLADGGDPWDLAGLEVLCHSCHSRITRLRGGG